MKQIFYFVIEFMSLAKLSLVNFPKSTKEQDVAYITLNSDSD